MKRYLLLLGALLTLPAVAAPTLVDLHYALSHNGLAVATMHDTFQRTGKQYRIVSTTAASGVIGMFYKGTLTSTSAGLIGPRGLRPLRFEQTRSDAQDKNIGARFDWKTSKLILLDKGRSETVALPPGTQDRLSVLYQFMFVKPGGQTLKFDVTTGHSLSPETYTLVNREKITTPVGDFNTLHYRNDAPAGEKQIEVWLATERDYLPVQVQVKDDGATALQTLTQIKTE
ncbi:MAG: DUF3108 domain-containing protein [Pseudomonadota bacterium]